jgi:hypothetical protein
MDMYILFNSCNKELLIFFNLNQTLSDNDEIKLNVYV